MRIVVALGGNALLERGERPDSDIQQVHVAGAVAAIVPLARRHDIVVTHGNGPQVGLLAIESAGDRALSHPYPFDVLVAQTQGMIGYWLAQELQNAVPEKATVGLICRTAVDPADPAFEHPTKFVGPVYDRTTATRLAERHGWTVRRDGQSWRRVVPSPEPVKLLELPTIELLIHAGTIVICSGGGGIPVVGNHAGRFRGVESVVDKDLTAALLATEIGADALLLLTDVPAVMDEYGTPQARPISHCTAAELRSRAFPAGSMGPKVEAACRFVEATGGIATIGRLDDAEALLAGSSGTTITSGTNGPVRQRARVGRSG